MSKKEAKRYKKAPALKPTSKLPSEWRAHMMSGMYSDDDDDDCFSFDNPASSYCAEMGYQSDLEDENEAWPISQSPASGGTASVRGILGGSDASVRNMTYAVNTSASLDNRGYGPISQRNVAFSPDASATQLNRDNFVMDSNSSHMTVRTSHMIDSSSDVRDSPSHVMRDSTGHVIGSTIQLRDGGFHGSVSVDEGSHRSVKNQSSNSPTTTNTSILKPTSKRQPSPQILRAQPDNQLSKRISGLLLEETELDHLNSTNSSNTRSASSSNSSTNQQRQQQGTSARQYRCFSLGSLPEDEVGDLKVKKSQASSLSSSTSLRELNVKKLGAKDADDSIQYLPPEEPAEGERGEEEAEEGEKKQRSRARWLWGVVRKAKRSIRSAKHQSETAEEPEKRGEGRKGSHIMRTMARPFSRSKTEPSIVFTVTDKVPFYEQQAPTDMEFSPVPPRKSTLLSTPPISLRRRAFVNNATAFHQPTGLSAQDSRSSSPLVQLSVGEFFGCAEETSSDTSSVKSLSLGSNDSHSDSGDSGRAGGGGRKERKGVVERVRGMRGQRTKVRIHSTLSSQEEGSPRSDSSQWSLRKSESAVSLSDSTRAEFEGPHGKLFTAKLFNRIGKKGALSNVTNVSHVYKGTILITDLLDGKILYTARSGRTVKWFKTEPGSEPWCACITPLGHVAATLKRPACVTVWSGNGTLVREFGHDVLQCPTGLACDRQGRFIVTDERTNLVAFFSPCGEFLRYLSHPPDQQQRQQSDRRSVSNHRSGEDCSSLRSDGSSDDSKEEDDTDIHERRTTVRFNLNPSEKCVYPNPTANLAVDPNHNPIVQNESVREDSKTIRTGEDSKTVDMDDSFSLDSTDRYEPYEFSLPRYVCVSSSGKVIVSDSGSHCVKVFSPAGIYLHSIGSYGSKDGQLKVPYGVCCDQKDNVYIADHYNDRVSVFSLDGQFLQQALVAVSGLSRPKSVAIHPAHARKLFVAHGGLRSTEVLVHRLESEQHFVTFECDL